MNDVPSVNPEVENNHLAETHGLIKTIAYIRCNSAKQRSPGAERVAKHRQQKKANGIVQIGIPFAVAEEIKAAGSFEVWVKQYQRLPSKKIDEINRAIRIAQKVSALHPWLRRILGL